MAEKVYSSTELLKYYTEHKWKLSKTQKTYLINHQILSKAKVTTDDNYQKFLFKVMALHKKKCTRVLRKLSLLEEYANWIDFIKSSTYKEESHLLTVAADHPLLPFPVTIHIIMERPTKQGHYTFYFPTGIFSGLTGSFEIIEIDKKCFLFGQSSWKGKRTKIPGFVIEVFSEPLSKIGGEILMRKSQ